MTTPARRRADEAYSEYHTGMVYLAALIGSEGGLLDEWHRGASELGVTHPDVVAVRSRWSTACERREEHARRVAELSQSLEDALREVEREVSA